VRTAEPTKLALAPQNLGRVRNERRKAGECASMKDLRHDFSNALGALVLAVAAVAANGCGDSMSSVSSSTHASSTKKDAGDSSDDSQTPPRGAKAVEAWLAMGAYETWHCEPEVHAARSPSPHGFNRICSNDALAGQIDGSATWPKGAAAVKELYATADAKSPVGYAVYLKTATDSKGGDNWYWYERVPSDSPAPHDADGVVADGLGTNGAAKTICVGCHVAAGSDAAHTPSEHGRDQVYTPVK
jgi:hypothetical protein